MAALFQQILTIMLDPINDAITACTLIIPNKIFDFVELANLQLIIHDNYLTALVDPTFIAPTGGMFADPKEFLKNRE